MTKDEMDNLQSNLDFYMTRPTELLNAVYKHIFSTYDSFEGTKKDKLLHRFRCQHSFYEQRDEMIKSYEDAAEFIRQQMFKALQDKYGFQYFIHEIIITHLYRISPEKDNLFTLRHNYKKYAEIVLKELEVE